MTLTDERGLDAFHKWLNPELPHVEVYDPKRLLAQCAEVDEATYDYFVGMLPPIYFSSEGFAIVEATTADIHLAFFRINGHFYAAYISVLDHRPMTMGRERIAAIICNNTKADAQ